MSITASSWAPFTLLDRLNIALSPQTQALTWSNFFLAVIAPFFPLGIQAYCLQFHGTRPIRIAVAAIGVGFIADAALKYRITDPEYNAFNVALHVGYLHILGKYIEFAALREPIIDSYLAKGRSRFLSAYDLCINSRWIGLPPVFPEEVRDPRRQVRNGASKRDQSNGHAHGVRQVNGGAKVLKDEDAVGIDQSRWLVIPTTRRTRLQATLNHFLLFAWSFTMCDTLLLYMRFVAPDSVGPAVPPPNVWQTYLNTPFTLLPHTPLAWRLPPWAIIFFTQMWVGAVIWQTLYMGYHFFALLAVGSGIWEVESWEPDIMYSPWKSDSLLDMWGRGWHQLFRHHFLILSIFLLRLFRLNPRGPLLLPLIFTWSAGLHVVAGHVMLAQVPGKSAKDLIPTGAFFMLSGVGCALEIAFRKYTGRRVEGPLGQIWLWGWLCLSALPGVQSWMEGGICGNLLTGRGSVGWVLLPLLRRVIDVVRP